MSRIIVDANVMASLVIPLPYSDLSAHRMTAWQHAGVELFAPMLLAYETTSALRKAIVAEMITADEAVDAVDALLALDVQAVAPTKALHDGALWWSERLDQGAAYDAQYLALAQQLGAEFWTADRRLVNRARKIGETWVRWIGEEGGGAAQAG